jgi:protein TonB
MIRLLAAILIGASVSFALFVFMAKLIAGGDNRNDEVKESIRVELFTQPPKSTTQTKRRVPPPPPPPPKQPPKAPEPEPENNDVDAGGFNMSPPTVDIGGDNIGLAGPGAGLGRDGDATPIVRIEPKYPMAAQRNGTEGWVKLSFTINELGEVEDVQVIDSEPRRVFDKEARRALKRWKYKPKMVDGKPVKMPNQIVQLDFTMEK